jgi:hypothetical protein
MKKTKYILFIVIAFLQFFFCMSGLSSDIEEEASLEKGTQYLEAILSVSQGREKEEHWKLMEEIFQKEDDGERLIAIKYSSFGPKAKERLIPFFANVAENDEYPEVRQAAILKIEKYNNMPDVKKAIIYMATKDQDSTNRIEALDIISRNMIKSALPKLESALSKEGDAKVNKKMSDVIEYLKTGKIKKRSEELLQLLKSSDPDVRAMALDAMENSVNSLDSSIINPLIEAYYIEVSKGNRIEILVLLAMIDESNKQVVDLLKSEVNNSDKDISHAASYILQEIEE